MEYKQIERSIILPLETTVVACAPSKRAAVPAVAMTGLQRDLLPCGNDDVLSGGGAWGSQASPCIGSCWPSCKLSTWFSTLALLLNEMSAIK